MKFISKVSLGHLSSVTEIGIREFRETETKFTSFTRRTQVTATIKRRRSKYKRPLTRGNCASRDERQLLSMQKQFKLRCRFAAVHCFAFASNIFNFTVDTETFNNRRFLRKGPAASGKPLAARHKKTYISNIMIDK